MTPTEWLAKLPTDKTARLAAVAAAMGNPEFIDAIARKWRVDRGVVEGWYVSLRAVIGKDDTLRLRSLVADRVLAIDAAVRAAQQLEGNSAENGPAAKTLADMLGRAQDWPSTVIVPANYTVERDGSIILRTVDDAGFVSELPVSPRPIFATGVLVDDDGAESLHLEWRDRRGWDSEVVKASLTQDPRAFVALRDRGAPIAAHSARRVSEWLANQQEASDLPRARSSTRLGWHGQSFALGARTIYAGGEVARNAPPSSWGTSHIRFGARDPGAEQLVANVHERGTWEDWCAAVRQVRCYPLVMLAIWASLAAPLLGVIPEAPNAIVDWSGDTSNGKTSALRLGASCWGQADEKRGPMIASWSSSPAKIEGIASTSHHIPVLLDDTKENKSKNKEEVAHVLYQFAHGQGRGRALPGGGTRATSTWRSVLLSTGEAPATSFTQDAGARARVLAIRALPFGDDRQEATVEALRLALSENYGHAGPRAVRWLLDHRSAWPSIRALYDERRRAYAAARPGAVAARVAHMMALLEAGGALATHIGVPMPETSPVAAAAVHAEAGIADTDRPASAMDGLYGWCVQHAADFWGRHELVGRGDDAVPRQPARGWAGQWDNTDAWTRIAIVPECLERVIRHLGHEPAGIIDSWIRRGWLDGDTDSRRVRPSRPVQIGRERTRCQVILRGVLDGTSR